MKHGSLALVVPFLLLVLLLSITGCTFLFGPPGLQTNPCSIEAPQGIPAPGVNESMGAASEASMVDANNRFARDMYFQLAADPQNTGSNLFFSPFSLSSGLAITYEGARGETADQIRSVFYFPADNVTMRTGYSRMYAGLAGGDRNFTLCAANALWAEKTYPLLPEYISTAGTWYSAHVTNLDFIGQPDASRQTINTWVADRTNNKIPALLPAGSITSFTRLGITNAVYFKGTWVKQFDPKDTADGDFHVSPSRVTSVKMMQRTDEDAHYRYAETPDLQMLSMPYAHGIGSGISMIVLLPRNSSLAPAEAALDPANLSALEQSATTRHVLVFFPKFTTTTDYSLSGPLATMGMPDAFSPEADFSGLDGTRQLNVSTVIHSAYVKVDEEGTEAAAATHVSFGMGAAAPEESVTFRADHPFIFLIQDNDTGTILFVGRIVDPGST
jgi:serpin B